LQAKGRIGHFEGQSFIFAESAEVRKCLNQVFERYTSIEDLAENLEDYCLSKAMDEARETPLLSREEAFAYLESEEDEVKSKVSPLRPTHPAQSI